jgi:hypothetical protein
MDLVTALPKALPKASRWDWRMASLTAQPMTRQTASWMELLSELLMARRTECLMELRKALLMVSWMDLRTAPPMGQRTWRQTARRMGLRMAQLMERWWEPTSAQQMAQAKASAWERGMASLMALRTEWLTPRWMELLTALPKASEWERRMERQTASWMGLLSEPLMVQQSVRQTVMLMAQLTGRQKAAETLEAVGRDTAVAVRGKAGMLVRHPAAWGVGAMLAAAAMGRVAVGRVAGVRVVVELVTGECMVARRTECRMELRKALLMVSRMDLRTAPPMGHRTVRQTARRMGLLTVQLMGR